MNRVESVVQLIGIDKNGSEIYEGDEIKSRFGNSCYANFRHYGGIIDGTYTFVRARIISVKEMGIAVKNIKFRGKEIKSNKYVYGFFIRCIDDCVIVTAEGLKTVYPDSVAQFVGLDADNKEVYEGDKFNDKYGHTLTARLNPQAVGNNGHIRFDWLPDNCEFHGMPDDFNVEEGYCDENLS